ncbi:MAG: hypothetical protein DHS20C08_24010 [Rhodomicrobium sp.]|nr:MAG: hypothetical protein DHS20C08_24010 [Rhodomicrobium sp.]
MPNGTYRQFSTRRFRKQNILWASASNGITPLALAESGGSKYKETPSEGPHLKSGETIECLAREGRLPLSYPCSNSNTLAFGNSGEGSIWPPCFKWRRGFFYLDWLYCLNLQSAASLDPWGQ